MYRCFLLYVIDYASVVYHSLLTGDQASALDRLQAAAIKIIFGRKTSYRAALELSGLEHLGERRLRMIDSFIIKTADNPRFIHWFPQRVFVHPNLRKEKIYLEKHARTERLYNSHLYFYRRGMNEISLTNLNRQSQ